LFIIGKFYKSVQAFKKGDEIVFNTFTPLGRAVTEKFDKVLGIGPQPQEEINFNYILPEVLNYVNKEL
jgi:hypothetical protein